MHNLGLMGLNMTSTDHLSVMAKSDFLYHFFTAPYGH